MTNIMNAADALSELGHQLGIPDLSLQMGKATIIFDEKFHVEFKQNSDDPNLLHLTSVLCAVDSLDAQTSFFELLLEANYLSEGTGGAAFALSTTGDQVLFTRTLVMPHLSYTDFSEAVESFINYYDGWLRKIDGGEISQQGAELTTEILDLPPVGAIRI